jgi:hypothetical protein
MRNLCLNLIIVDNATVKLGTKRHVGHNLYQFILASLQAASDKVQYFANKWDSAKYERLELMPSLPVKVLGNEAPEEIARGVLNYVTKHHDGFALPGYRGELSVNKYVESWRKEPELTKAGIINAVTRTAHEIPLKGDVWAVERIEAAAGKLLMSKKPLTWQEQYGVDF